MTEQGRLRWIVDRLVEAQQEALEVCGAALDPSAAGFEGEEEARAFREEERMRAALEDVHHILVAASQDVQGGGLPEEETE
ncbi:MAG: hypothetical protein M3N18_02105 [Actinomycetota bacterium]|nr:hypothetical protein [Actinomycetota bacterium]